jgi:hypothetical protein
MTDMAAVKIPLYERINLRLIVFAAVIMFVVGYPMYLYLDSELSGGIKNAGNGYKQVDLKAMSSFTFDQDHGTVNDVPKKWRELDGQKVVLYGEMWAPDSASDQVDHFDLCYSIAKCCFSGPPQVQHFVKSHAKTEPVPFYSGLVKVEGTLHVDVKSSGDKVASVYQLDVEKVEPAG